jgi:hypothetical protein
MNALKNKVQLIGHLGSKLDLKSLDSGKSVGNVSLATSEVYKNQKGERIEETIWHNLVVWDKTAENLAKGYDSSFCGWFGHWPAAKRNPIMPDLLIMTHDKTAALCI